MTASRMVLGSFQWSVGISHIYSLLVFVPLYCSNSGPCMSSASTSERTFPPLYSPTGNESKDRLAFFHILERLKVTTRSHFKGFSSLRSVDSDTEAYRLG